MTVLYDQATQLRTLARGRARASVIAITSGKGGVGKSNISVNLAIRFAAAGKEVVLLDADLGLANADVLCNIDLHANLSHVIARRKELRDAALDLAGRLFVATPSEFIEGLEERRDAHRENRKRAKRMALYSV